MLKLDVSDGISIRQNLIGDAILHTNSRVCPSCTSNLWGSVSTLCWPYDIDKTEKKIWIN